MSNISKIQLGANIYEIEDALSRTTLLLKANLNSPEFTGVPTTPTPDGETSTQIANVQYVLDAFKANDAMLFKGVVDANHALPTQDYEVGWTYKVAANGAYAGKICEIGDMLICVAENGANDDWAVIQTNIDGAVTGPANAVDNHVALFDGTSGKLIQDSGFVLEQSVTTGSKLTDTLYEATTTQVGSATAGQAITASNVTSWSTGVLPTLGTEIAADEITSWSTGTLPTLGEELAATKVDSWTAGVAPTLGTPISADKITSWSTGVLPTYEVSGDTLILTAGSLPVLSYSTESIPNVTNAGSAAVLETSNVNIPNVTSVGSLPTLQHTVKNIPNVTSVGSLPALAYDAQTIPNISVQEVTVVNGIVEAQE